VIDRLLVQVTNVQVHTTAWAIKTVPSHYAVYIYLHAFNCRGRFLWPALCI